MNQVPDPDDPLIPKSIIKNIPQDALAETKFKVRNISKTDYPGENITSPLKIIKLRD
jgi:hypothetical protein